MGLGHSCATSVCLLIFSLPQSQFVDSLPYLALNAYGFTDGLPEVVVKGGIVISAISYALYLYDFVDGWRLDWPSPRFPEHRANRSRVKSNYPHSHPMSVTLVRLIMMIFPPLVKIVGYFINKKYAHIPYTGENHEHLSLDVIVSKTHKKTDRSPVLLYVHGGAWVLGSKDHVGLLPVNFVARMGWVVVTANYRLSKFDGTGAVWPEHIVDVKRAICWVKENIELYGGDPNTIVICGGSAGGHLSALSAVTPNMPAFQPGFEDKDTTIQGCISVYGVMDMADQHSQWLDFDEFHGHRPTDDKPAILIQFLQHSVFGKKLEHHRDEFLQASPLHHAKQKQHDVPFLIVHGTRDVIVPVTEARLLRDHLRADLVTYFEVEHAHHSFDMHANPRAFVLLDCMEEWLQAFEIWNKDQK